MFLSRELCSVLPLTPPDDFGTYEAFFPIIILPLIPICNQHYVALMLVRAEWRLASKIKSDFQGGEDSYCGHLVMTACSLIG